MKTILGGCVNKTRKKDARIRELEEKIQQVKVYERNVKNFKASSKKVSIELEEAIKDMYVNMHLFQQEITTFIDQCSQVQAKLMQFNTIQERMGYINQWITENPDAPTKRYLASKMERKTYSTH
jgi:hypothetical protein